MNANDWIKILTEREQYLTAILDQFRASDDLTLQLVASKMGPLFDELLEAQKKVLSTVEQHESQQNFRCSQLGQLFLPATQPPSSAMQTLHHLHR